MGIRAGDFNRILRCLTPCWRHRSRAADSLRGVMPGDSEPVWGSLLCDSHPILEGWRSRLSSPRAWWPTTCCQRGRVTPRSTYRGFEIFSFGQKKRPSPLAKALVLAVLRRLDDLATAAAAVDVAALVSSKGGRGTAVPSTGLMALVTSGTCWAAPSPPTLGSVPRQSR
jgi:hypothetical protein